MPKIINEKLLPIDQAGQYKDSNWGSDQLKKISLLKNFSKEELKKMYDTGEIRSYKPKAYAVIEGEPSRGLFIILSGTVSVYKNDAISGNMHRLTFMQEGAHFGELSLFDDAPRSATVCAETISHMFYLDADLFEKFLESSGPDTKIRFYKTCAVELSNRFRVLNQDYIHSQQVLWRHALKIHKDEDEQKQNSDQPETSNDAEPVKITIGSVPTPPLTPQK